MTKPPASYRPPNIVTIALKWHRDDILTAIARGVVDLDISSYPCRSLHRPRFSGARHTWRHRLGAFAAKSPREVRLTRHGSIAHPAPARQTMVRSALQAEHVSPCVGNRGTRARNVEARQRHNLAAVGLASRLARVCRQQVTRREPTTAEDEGADTRANRNRSRGDPDSEGGSERGRDRPQGRDDQT